MQIRRSAGGADCLGTVPTVRVMTTVLYGYGTTQHAHAYASHSEAIQNAMAAAQAGISVSLQRGMAA